MKLQRIPLRPAFIASIFVSLPLLTGAARAQETTTVKFSDPDKPGTLKIVVARGDLHVRGTDTTEVTIASSGKAAAQARRSDGLREIAAAGSFLVSEKNNVITLDALSDRGAGGEADFEIIVPRRTSLVVQNFKAGGDVTCVDITGDVEVHTTNGEIHLERLAGGVAAEAYNGKISASIAELHENKPLSFTSMNGEVLVRVPSSAKASVRLRTQNGSVLTDFPESALVTRVENTPPGARRRLTGKGVLPPEAQEAIREAARMSAQAIKEASRAIHEGLDEARDQVANARQQVEAEREQKKTPRAAAGSAAPEPPVPAVPAVPTITGGKLVTGALNGGGPEISVSTMNGDIVLRKSDGP
jgi:hypothetical protein